MSSIVVQAFITLDGVVQAPNGKDEDNENDFKFGDWTTDYEMIAASQFGGDDGTALIREWEAKTEALLLGRKTYEVFAASWGVRDENAEGLIGEFTRRYNRVPKYVATRTLTELSWQNSHLLGDDVPAAVRKIRDAPGGEIRVWGSTELITTLAEHDLIDEYRLIQYPVVLGSGKKLFPEGFPRSSFHLVDSRMLPTRLLVNIYRRLAD